MGHSRTPTQNTAGDRFPADPIDGYVRAVIKRILAPSATVNGDLPACLCAGRRTENPRSCRDESGAGRRHRRRT